MVFSSAIFLFAFLPLLYVVYRLTPGIRAKNIILLIFSLLFYSFGRLADLPVLLASILINWGAGRALGAVEPEKKRVRRIVVTAAAVVNIGLLTAYKYLDFLFDAVNGVFGSSLVSPGLSLPLGISFFTFTGLGYVIEVYRKPKSMSQGFARTALYIALFPNLLSGPILDYKALSPQLDERACSPERTARGLRRFVLGLSKKLLIADIVGAMVDTIYAGEAMDARLAWLGAVGYAVQVYFDFSGYTDMALGLGDLFGFTFPENFHQPYSALSMTDYWKRWHMSLTTWFRNYLYMPMVMSRPLRRLYKRWADRRGRPSANKLSLLIPTTVVWLLTGLWHGPSWTYVLWGLLNGLFCLLEAVGLIRTERLRRTAGGRALLHVYTLAVVLVGAVLFRAGSIPQAGRMLAAMAAGWRFTALGTFTLEQCLTGLCVFCLGAGLVGCLPIVPWLKTRTGRWGEPASYALCAVLLALCIARMASTGFEPFIYLQF